MFCPNCGNDCASFRFCPNCGMNLENLTGSNEISKSKNKIPNDHGTASIENNLSVKVPSLDIPLSQILSDIKLFLQAKNSILLYLMSSDMACFKLHQNTYQILDCDDKNKAIKYIYYLFDFDLFDFSLDEWSSYINIASKTYCNNLNYYPLSIINIVKHPQIEHFFNNALMSEPDERKINNDLREIIQNNVLQYYKKLTLYISKLQSNKITIKQLIKSSKNEGINDAIAYGGGIAMAYFNPFVGVPALFGKFIHSMNKDSSKNIIIDEFVETYSKLVNLISENTLSDTIKTLEQYFNNQINVYFSSLQEGIIYFTDHSNLIELSQISYILSTIIYNDSISFENSTNKQFTFLVLDSLLENKDLYPISEHFNNILEEKRNEFRQFFS